MLEKVDGLYVLTNPSTLLHIILVFGKIPVSDFKFKHFQLEIQSSSSDHFLLLTVYFLLYKDP